MDYTIAAIPTMYAGIQFRSRLEAKWAAFFDGCGWRWDYEPNDWNGYIPDFRIGHTYFEVKPSRTYDEAAANKAIRAIPIGPDCAEVHQFVLLKDSPQDVAGFPFCRSIGWFLDGGSSRESDAGDCLILPAAPMSDSPTMHLRYYLATWGDHGTINPTLPGTAFAFGHLIDHHWATACNRTQWKASA